MRHLKRTAKLGRTFEHRNAMLANMVCSLIKHKRITTTLAKAKAARSVAEKMVTLGKKDTLHARRLASAKLHTHGPTVRLSKAAKTKWRAEEDVIRILFEDIAPAFKGRAGGYTRIIQMEQRPGDAANKAILEWVDEVVAATPETKPDQTGSQGRRKEIGFAPANTARSFERAFFIPSVKRLPKRLPVWLVISPTALFSVR